MFLFSLLAGLAHWTISSAPLASFSHMKTFTPSPDASHASVIGAEQAHEDARGAYGSADREWGLPQKSSLLEGFDFKTRRLILHFLRLTIVSRNPFRTTLVWFAYYFIPLKIHLFYLYLPKSSYNKNRYRKKYMFFIYTRRYQGQSQHCCVQPLTW